MSQIPPTLAIIVPQSRRGGSLMASLPFALAWKRFTAYSSVMTTALLVHGTGVRGAKYGLMLEEVAHSTR